jgi:hypothetical protein
MAVIPCGLPFVVMTPAIWRDSHGPSSLAGHPFALAPRPLSELAQVAPQVCETVDSAQLQELALYSRAPSIVLSLLTPLEKFGASLLHRPAMLDATNDDDLNLAPRWACFAPSDERLHRMDRLADRCHHARKPLLATLHRGPKWLDPRRRVLHFDIAMLARLAIGCAPLLGSKSIWSPPAKMEWCITLS